MRLTSSNAVFDRLLKNLNRQEQHWVCLDVCTAADPCKRLTCRLPTQSHKEGLTLRVPTASTLLMLASSHFAEGFRRGARMYTAARPAIRAAAHSRPLPQHIPPGTGSAPSTNVSVLDICKNHTHSQAMQSAQLEPSQAIYYETSHTSYVQPCM